MNLNQIKNAFNNLAEKYDKRSNAIPLPRDVKLLALSLSGGVKHKKKDTCKMELSKSRQTNKKLRAKLKLKTSQIEDLIKRYNKLNNQLKLKTRQIEDFIISYNKINKQLTRFKKKV